MKDGWTRNSSCDRERGERREGEECNQTEKVVGKREIKQNMLEKKRREKETKRREEVCYNCLYCVQ